MAVYLSFDGGEPEDFASNTGWADVVAWLNTLAADAYPQAAHLADYGWSQELPALAAELAAALRDRPPGRPDVLATARGLLESVRGSPGAEAVSVTS